jgi:hypothetical protein
MNLKHLTDKALLTDTKVLATIHREVTAKLLHHLREIEHRKLYSELGYSSLFSYAVQELGFDESSASRRIKASRLLEIMPEIEEKIESGELSLSNLAKASDAFKANDITENEKKKEIIGKIENLSMKNCEKTLIELTGKELPPPRRELKPITKTLNLLTVTISDEGAEILNQLKGLLAHRKLSQEKLYELIFIKAKERIEAERFKTESKSTRKGYSETRYIAAADKRDIYLRDKKCQKCGSTYGLELAHEKPFSMGGKTINTNLKILCRNCNQRDRITQRL